MPWSAIVVVPTLNAGRPLERCLEALSRQTFRDFETVVVDNSGRGLASGGDRVIDNAENVGFGGAINQAIESSDARYICALNDDARPAPGWLAALIAAAEEPGVGMCASRILLSADEVDSTGLGIYPDGTTKQRRAGAGDESLLPSGCAALYKREMIAQVGAFDPDYFLYGEDTDLGLRGRLAGWDCVYVPEAVVEHDYSASSGRASELKAFYVERNRLFTVVKNFPLALWLLVPLFSLWRYLAHLGGGGLAGEYRGGALGLAGIVAKAHWHALMALPALLAKRRQVRRFAKLGAWDFWKLMRRHGISAREIAAQ